MIEIKKGRGYEYSIQYYIVWCVKYRQKIMTGDIANRFRAMLAKMAEDNGFTIEKLDIEPDYIRLQIDCSPQHYIPNILKGLKGVSARLLMKECGDSLRSMLRDGHLWGPSYLVLTKSEDTEAQIGVYLQSQKR
jgi:putative transposase